MRLKKEIIILGDTEMGAGNITDDFISDKALSNLILKFAKKRTPIDLILNGDTFDFLKCPYVKKKRNKFKVKYPKKITEEISLNKLENTYLGHKKVFQALKKFVSFPKNNLYFIIGNHDCDLFFPEVQKRIRTLLKGQYNIFFPLVYEQHGVYAEHGHQYDPLNAVDLQEIFITKRKKTFIKQPDACEGVLFNFMKLKAKHHPFLERIKPVSALLAHHKKLGKKIKRRTVLYFSKRMLGYSMKRLVNKKTKFPKELVREAAQRIKKQVDCDITDIVTPFKKKKRSSLHRNRLYVFGHVHHSYVEKHKKATIIHTDTWRDEYIFEVKTRKLVPKKKAYVYIKVPQRGKLHWKLIELPSKRTKIDFDDVLQDEMKYLRKAAREEGFRMRI